MTRIRPWAPSACRRRGRIRSGSGQVRGPASVRWSAPPVRGRSPRRCWHRAPGRDRRRAWWRRAQPRRRAARALCGVLRKAERHVGGATQVGGRLAQLCGGLFEVVVHARVDHVANLVLDLAELPEASPDRSAEVGQALRAHDDQRDDDDEQELRRSDVEHGRRESSRASSYPTVAVPRRSVLAGQDVCPDRDGGFSDPARELARAAWEVMSRAMGASSSCIRRAVRPSSNTCRINATRNASSTTAGARPGRTTTSANRSRGDATRGRRPGSGQEAAAGASVAAAGGEEFGDVPIVLQQVVELDDVVDREGRAFAATDRGGPRRLVLVEQQLSAVDLARRPGRCRPPPRPGAPRSCGRLASRRRRRSWGR